MTLGISRLLPSLLYLPAAKDHLSEKVILSNMRAMIKPNVMTRFA